MFTHNHPENGPLSLEDIWSALQLDIREMRAIRKNGSIAKMSRPKEGWFRHIGPDYEGFIQSLEVGYRKAVLRALIRTDSLNKFDEEVRNDFIEEETRKEFNAILKAKTNGAIKIEVEMAKPRGNIGARFRPRP